MTYVIKFCNNQKYEPWWNNFRNSVSGMSPSKWIVSRDKELAKYNAIRSNAPYSIEFETEEDAMIFILKWS